MYTSKSSIKIEKILTLKAPIIKAKTKKVKTPPVIKSTTPPALITVDDNSADMEKVEFEVLIEAEI